MKYNLKRIMQNAWKNYRKQAISFAEALHRAWLSAKAEAVNAERIELRKMAAVRYYPLNQLYGSAFLC